MFATVVGVCVESLMARRRSHITELIGQSSLLPTSIGQSSLLRLHRPVLIAPDSFGGAGPTATHSPRAGGIAICYVSRYAASHLRALRAPSAARGGQARPRGRGARHEQEDARDDAR